MDDVRIRINNKTAKDLEDASILIDLQKQEITRQIRYRNRAFYLGMVIGGSIMSIILTAVL